MKKPKPNSPKTKITDLTHDTVPATVGLVKEVREELRADIKGVDYKIGSLNHRFDSIDHKFDFLSQRVDSLDNKVDSLDRKVDSLDHKIDSVRIELKGDIQNVLSETQQILVTVHRSQVLMEEQRGENKIVLAGIKNLYERQNRIETDIQKLQHPAKSL